MKIIFVEIRIFGSKVIFFNFLSYYIDYIVGSTSFFFYQNGPWEVAIIVQKMSISASAVC